MCESRETKKRKKAGGDKPGKTSDVDMKQLIRELDPVRFVSQQKGARILGTCRQVEEVDQGEEEEEEDEEGEGEGDDDSASMARTVADEETEDEEDQEDAGDDAQADKDDQSTSTKDGAMDTDAPSIAANAEEEGLDEKDWWRMKEHRGDVDLTGAPSKPEDVIEMGAKVHFFLQLLAQACDRGEKILLFSQSIPTLDFLEIVLAGTWGDDVGVVASDSFRKTGQVFRNWRRGSMSPGFLRIDGAVSDRKDLIDRFNSDKKIHLFLLSTKAGKSTKPSSCSPPCD